MTLQETIAELRNANELLERMVAALEFVQRQAKADMERFRAAMVTLNG